MRRSIYLRPIGFVPRPVEEDLDIPHLGVSLAGGRLSFTGLEVIERYGKSIDRHSVSLSEFFERDWGRHTMPASDLLEAMQEPRGRLKGLSMDRPRIMGIVNVTPDSFSDGGNLGSVQAAVEHALELEAHGADILDIGGESTRPGAALVPVEDELSRVLPVLKALRVKTDALISIDTRKAAVMLAAAEAGVDIINDVLRSWRIYSPA